MVAPVLQITRPQQVRDEPQKAVIENPFRNDGQQNLMVNTVIASGNIPFDKPGTPMPRMVKLRQRRVTTTVRTEAMGMSGKLRLIVSLQNEPDDLLQQLIRPR